MPHDLCLWIQLNKRKEKQSKHHRAAIYRPSIIIRVSFAQRKGDSLTKLLIVWLINALVLLALPYVVPSVQVDSFVTALVAALILGLVNTMIRPVLVLLTLPATVLTLGLFIFVINGLLFWMVASFVDGFQVAGFWSGVLGAIVYGFISWMLSALIISGK
jgi:putative membrane protein